MELHWLNETSPHATKKAQNGTVNDIVEDEQEVAVAELLGEGEHCMVAQREPSISRVVEEHQSSSASQWVDQQCERAVGSCGAT